ncbi:hypothetical protein, partial [Onishia taeanensis]
PDRKTLTKTSASNTYHRIRRLLVGGSGCVLYGLTPTHARAFRQKDRLLPERPGTWASARWPDIVASPFSGLFGESHQAIHPIGDVHEDLTGQYLTGMSADFSLCRRVTPGETSTRHRESPS